MAKTHYVEKRRLKKGRWLLVDRHGPYTKAIAHEIVVEERRHMLSTGAWRLNAIPDRRAYWKAYHADKMKTDPEYVRKKRAYSTNWYRRVRAKLKREDIRP
jgi:hypothetical protein